MQVNLNFWLQKALWLTPVWTATYPESGTFCSAAGDSNAKELLASAGEAGAAISRTLALLNSAGTNFINYLLKVKVRTEWSKSAASVAQSEAKRFQLQGGFAPLTPDQGLCPWPRWGLHHAMPAMPRSPCLVLKPPTQTWYFGLASAKISCCDDVIYPECHGLWLMSTRVNEVNGENLQDPPQSKILATPMILT